MQNFRQRLKTNRPEITYQYLCALLRGETSLVYINVIGALTSRLLTLSFIFIRLTESKGRECRGRGGAAEKPWIYPSSFLHVVK